MLSEPASEHPPQISPPLGYSRRAEPDELPEWMDEPCSYDDFRDCLHDLEQVNRLSLGYRPTLDFIQAAVARHPSPAPLSVVDVGCGGGDALRRIAQWAADHSISLALMGVDLNPYAKRYAEELKRQPAAAATIRWVTGDAFALPASRRIDIVLSSLFTHHLPEPEIVRFLAWMENTAQLGWFINDLERSPRAARLFHWLSRIARWHKFVQHDGPVSFRRAFQEEDWRRMLQAAGIAADDVSLEHWNPGRLCLRRLK